MISVSIHVSLFSDVLRIGRGCRGTACDSRSRRPRSTSPGKRPLPAFAQIPPERASMRPAGQRCAFRVAQFQVANNRGAGPHKKESCSSVPSISSPRESERRRFGWSRLQLVGKFRSIHVAQISGREDGLVPARPPTSGKRRTRSQRE